MIASYIKLFLADVAPIALNKPIDVTNFVGDKSGLSYELATIVMSVVDWILGIFGLEHNTTLVTFVYAVVVFGISLVVGYIVQWILFALLRVITKKWNGATYNDLVEVRFFHKLCRVIPPLVFLILIEFTLSNHDVLSSVLTRLTLIYVVCAVVIALSALILAIWRHVDRLENKRRLPLKGLAQLARGIVWLIAIIVIIAILVNKSPASLLAGLGAFAAVLMLVFKDSILGLVAGVQLAENDSLHVGDWISVHGTDANGTVEEVNLTFVKIQNWDKTTTTVPPYSLISGSFTNYRSMQESNTRRICRSYMIDADSVLPCTPDMLDHISKTVPFMADFIATKLRQKAEGKVADVDNPEGLVNGTIDTNLGLFRAYMKMWLDANPHISHDSDCFVSTLAQTAAGIPFQVYCFTNTSKWFPYEAIQDSVFEHLAAMLHFFQLYTFENASGRDTVVDGYLSPGKDIDNVFGIPYPFFQAPDSPDSPASSRVAPKLPQTTPTETTPVAPASGQPAAAKD